MSQRVCGAETKAGDPCQAWSVCDDHGCCYSHDPCREAERREARSRGGYATAQRRSEDDDPFVSIGETPRPVENMEDIAAWGAWAMVMVATGRLGNARGRTIAKLGDLVRKALERGDAKHKLEETIQRLEDAIESGGGPGLKAVP